MKTKSKKMIGAIFFAAIANFSFAQSIVKQVIVLNEGPFGGPVIVGTYNPTTQVYSNFATINARFASDVIIDGNYIYVAADSLLVKYDKITYALIDSQIVRGIRELSVWNNQLLVTRAEVSALPSYFQVYDKNTLNFIYELPAVSGRCAEVKVLNDTAYAAVNNWGTMGKLAVIDLNGQTLNREVDLGPNGLNIETVRVQGNKIYTVNSLNWTNSSVTEYDGITTNFSNRLLGTAANCSASALRNGNIYFQVSGENKLGVYDVAATNVWDTLLINNMIYGMGIDTINNYIYTGVTDFVTTGQVFIYDLNGNFVHSFNVDVSPGTFAFDIGAVTAMPEIQYQISVSAFPNPVVDKLNVSLKERSQIEIVNVLGEKIYSTTTDKKMFSVDFSSQPQGVYFMKVRNESGEITRKIVKQ